MFLRTMEVRAWETGMGGDLRLCLTKWPGSWQTDSVPKAPSEATAGISFWYAGVPGSMTARTCPPSPPHLRIDVSLRRKLFGAT
jgi:hypothetical protein